MKRILVIGLVITALIITLTALVLISWTGKHMVVQEVSAPSGRWTAIVEEGVPNLGLQTGPDVLAHGVIIVKSESNGFFISLVRKAQLVYSLISTGHCGKLVFAQYTYPGFTRPKVSWLSNQLLIIDVDSDVQIIHQEGHFGNIKIEIHKPLRLDLIYPLGNRPVKAH